jgi:hypothetical protein
VVLETQKKNIVDFVLGFHVVRVYIPIVAPEQGTARLEIVEVPKCPAVYVQEGIRPLQRNDVLLDCEFSATIKVYADGQRIWASRMTNDVTAKQYSRKDVRTISQTAVGAG